MLTTDILNNDDILNALTDEQKAAICTLSQNDENAVIAKRIGEIYGALDNDILNVSGVEKQTSEKTYDYCKRVLGDLTNKAKTINDLNATITTLTEDKNLLEKTISDGGADEEIKKQLTQTKADLASVTKQFTDLNTKFAESEKQHESAIFNMRLDNDIANATSGLKFKTTIPSEVAKVIVQQTAEKIKKLNPAYIDNGNGEKILAYTTEDGAIMRNPSNQLNPYTTKELLTAELAKMGVLDEQRKREGSGTKLKTYLETSITISGARTQQEAYEIITNNLLSRGIAVGSKEFEEAMNQAWKENNVKTLPNK